MPVMQEGTALLSVIATYQPHPSHPAAILENRDSIPAPLPSLPYYLVKQYESQYASAQENSNGNKDQPSPQAYLTLICIFPTAPSTLRA
jgi:hypothetical protein